MIARRTAYRIWRACCQQQADDLRALCSDRALEVARDRSGLAGLAGATAKADGRLRRAERLERAADVLAAWVGGRGPEGADLAPEVAGLVAAWIWGDTGASDRLRERAAARGLLDAPDPADLIAFIRWTLDMETS
jgi:hypothetical protein